MNKTMKKKSIGINLVHTFKKLLDSTSFGTETTFMLELLQNTQRAGARKVEIELCENHLRVKDDGEKRVYYCDVKKLLKEKAEEYYTCKYCVCKIR